MSSSSSSPTTWLPLSRSSSPPSSSRARSKSERLQVGVLVLQHHGLGTGFLVVQGRDLEIRLENVLFLFVAGQGVRFAGRLQAAVGVQRQLELAVAVRLGAPSAASVSLEPRPRPGSARTRWTTPPRRPARPRSPAPARTRSTPPRPWRPSPSTASSKSLDESSFDTGPGFGVAPESRLSSNSISSLPPCSSEMPLSAGSCRLMPLRAAPAPVSSPPRLTSSLSSVCSASTSELPSSSGDGSASPTGVSSKSLLLSVSSFFSRRLRRAHLGLLGGRLVHVDVGFGQLERRGRGQVERVRLGPALARAALGPRGRIGPPLLLVQVDLLGDRDARPTSACRPS